MNATVYVTFKKSVLDPQGKAIQSGLQSLGFQSVQEVRAGKVIELKLKDSVSRQDAESDLKRMCEKLLANPVIEEYRWEIKEG